MPYLSRWQASTIAKFLETSRVHFLIPERRCPSLGSRYSRHAFSRTLLIASGIGSLFGAPAYAEAAATPPGRVERRSENTAPTNPVNLLAQRAKVAIERMP